MLRTINKHHLDDLDDMQELLHITHGFWRVRESGHLTWTWPYLNFEPTTTLRKTRTKDMQCKRTATGSRGKIPIYEKILPPTRCPASGQNYTRNIMRLTSIKPWLKFCANHRASHLLVSAPWWRLLSRTITQQLIIATDLSCRWLPSRQPFGVGFNISTWLRRIAYNKHIYKLWAMGYIWLIEPYEWFIQDLYEQLHCHNSVHTSHFCVKVFVLLVLIFF